MSASRNQISNGIAKSEKKLPIKLSNNPELDRAISRANSCYMLRFRLSRRLESCLLKDPNLKEEHCKGKIVFCLQYFSYIFAQASSRKHTYIILTPLNPTFI